MARRTRQNGERIAGLDAGADVAGGGGDAAGAGGAGVEQGLAGAGDEVGCVERVRRDNRRSRPTR